MNEPSFENIMKHVSYFVTTMMVALASIEATPAESK